ncbi:hypothetical protein ACFQS2_02615 [Brachybacterium sp. GCM10030267]|uniref:hypothetical protein n=1 Tax=Brachybacterium sp. GCM10030267 TaxID=3273381 RepID=UPI00361F908F
MPIDQARAMSEEMLPPLQDALLTGPDAQWTDGREQATTDVRGTCRWTPGDATAETAIPQEKSTWMERRDAVNDVLEDHGFDAVWEPMQKNGTYGFSTSREDGAGIALYATKGGTVIRLFNVPVADGACE